MIVGEKTVQNKELLDLPDDALIRIFCKLDLEGLIRVGSSAKKMQQVGNDELVWMERCRAWENMINLKSWRAGMDSGKALYRALHSLGKLAGLWMLTSSDPFGGLCYVTWGVGRLHVWDLIPGGIDDDEDIEFCKAFDVIAQPDGSHQSKLIFPIGDKSGSFQKPVHVILPSAQAPNVFGVDYYHAFAGDLTSSASDTDAETTGERQVQLRMYKRLTIEEPSPGQELCGLWTGLYGPHGWEILSVSYSDDFIIATKLTGDPNVPAGQVTFKGAICTETSDVPESLGYLMHHTRSCGLTKMYEGEGRIAEENFQNPNWVPGHLLVEKTGNFCFVWTDAYFMIGFCRVDLDTRLKDFVQKEKLDCETLRVM